MIEVKAPNNYSSYSGMKSIFLAGSIEMGRAELWQDKIVEDLKNIEDLLILNPRRDNWDSSWEQSINNPNFKEQVEWELQGLEDSDFIIVYYCADTKSPITLLELGLHAKTTPEKLIVCCPEGFWRKGNVDIVCAKYGVKQVSSLNQIISVIKKEF